MSKQKLNVTVDLQELGSKLLDDDITELLYAKGLSVYRIFAILNKIYTKEAIKELGEKLINETN